MVFLASVDKGMSSYPLRFDTWVGKGEGTEQTYHKPKLRQTLWNLQIYLVPNVNIWGERRQAAVETQVSVLRLSVPSTRCE